MIIKILRTREEYDKTVQRIYDLINADEVLLSPGSREADELELLTLLAEKYEREHYPVKAPDPVEAIRFRMEQMNLRQKDIAPLFGGKTRISEVLGRKRPLSFKMMILLNRYLGIPMESLVAGNKSAILDKAEREKILEVPSIKEYFQQHGSRAPRT